MPKTYTTIQGDCWDGIAKKMYGSEAGTNILLEANSTYAETAVFGAGGVLNVPDYMPQKTDLLPPWRR